ncbi:hypothetical protein KJ909_00955, partial [Patescibacteria group bacterium]|nr:hypothetical protein [Patescibacteria group bacterium]
GDVSANSSRLYDDDCETALLVVLTKSTKVQAPWGACAYDADDVCLDQMIAADIARGFAPDHIVVVQH